MLLKIIIHLMFSGTLVMTADGKFYMSSPDKALFIRCTQAGECALNNGLIENGPPINKYSRLMNLTQAGRDYLRGNYGSQN